MKPNKDPDMQTLDRLLVWLAFYVVLLSLACWYAGKTAELPPILTHLISGFAGAAFAMMRSFQKPADTDEKEKPAVGA